MTLSTPPIFEGRDFADSPDGPLVSVLIPAFNAANTIERALTSVRIQDYRNLEIIVVDDGSTDDTARIVTAFDDPRIRLVSMERNQGECAAMNMGIAASEGKYVAFLDADDEWLPGKIRKQVGMIESNPGISFVVCDCLTVYPDGEISGTDDRYPLVDGPEAWRTLLEYTFVAKPCVLASRALLRELEGFDPALHVAGDQDMWIRLALKGEVGCIRESLVRVYDTPGSLMKSYPRGEYDYLLPMIRKYIREQRARLGQSKSDRILGVRLSRIGRNLYTNGYPGLGVRVLFEAMANGADVLGNLRLLVLHSPLARRVRRIVRLIVARK